MRRVIAVLFLVALAATACGKGASNQGLARLDQTGFISQAAAQSLSEKTAKVSMTETVTPPAGRGNPITIQANGVLDMAHKIMEMTVNMPIANLGRLQMIMANGNMYMKVPDALRSAAGISRQWLGIKILGKGQHSPLSLSNFTDPSSVLDALHSIASSVTKGGTVTVRGVQTTEYDVTLDAAKLAAKAPPSERAAISRLNLNNLKVYLSSDNLIRREGFEVDAAGASLSVTIDIFDYGTPVNVSIPPASEVDFKSIPALTGQ